ncbi:Kup protein [Plautia stali symbiont]|nr:Kup protein [Plautia stali symbiont]
MRIIFTSHTESGQIYIPVVNWLLFTAVMLIVLAFRQSSALSSAYGMVITACLAGVVALRNWRWPLPLALLFLLCMLVVDVPLFIANLICCPAAGCRCCWR